MELLSGLLNGEISGLPRVKLKRLQFARKPVARYHDRTAGGTTCAIWRSRSSSPVKWQPLWCPVPEVPLEPSGVSPHSAGDSVRRSQSLRVERDGGPPCPH